MARAKKRVATSERETSDGHYKKVDDLPEERRKAYQSILDDFDKQVEARIEENKMTLLAMQNQIRAQFKMALLQIPRKEKNVIFEEVLNSCEDPRLSIQLAAVKANIESAIGNKVAVAETKPPKSALKKSALKGSARKDGKVLSNSSSDTSVILAPSSAVRQSSRKRVPKTYFEEPDAKKTPMVGRGQGKTVMQTPANNLIQPPGGLPFITPKFNIATPLPRTVMRIAKPHETLVSLSGSPVYVGPVAGTTTGRGRGKKGSVAAESLTVSVPLGGGKTLMVPAESPTAGADCHVDLDDEDKRRLKALRSQIDSMLKYRSEN